MSYIELDHTSSGVQIAAALARDESSATIVNINGGSAKRDIYNEVVAASNKGFEALGSPVRLTRADVKKAVIATIYGGTHKTVYEAFQVATGLGFKGNEEVYRVFKAAIDDKLKGVVTVQRYFEYIAKEVHATGASGVTIALASGAEFYVRFRNRERTRRRVRSGLRRRSSRPRSGTARRSRNPLLQQARRIPHRRASPRRTHRDRQARFLRSLQRRSPRGFTGRRPSSLRHRTRTLRRLR